MMKEQQLNGGWIPVNEKLPDCGGISIIALCLDANRLAGCVFYHSDNVNRTEIHEEICEALGLSHNDADMQYITNNLDKTVGFQIGMDYDAEEIYNFATKLYEILNELDSK